MSIDNEIIIEAPNEDTGEITQYLITPAKKKKVAKGDWALMFLEGAREIAKLKLKGESLRVYMILLSKLDYENWLRFRQKDIAEELDMQKQHVSRAIKELTDNGILVRGPKVSNAYTYRLDPSFAFRGKDVNIPKVRKEINHLKRIK